MRTVLITGASRGIGRAAALRLAKNGWHVLATVRRQEDAAELADAQLAGKIQTLILDVTDAAGIEQLDREVPEPLDAVVNNAGIVVPGPLESLSSDDVRRQLEVNVIAPVAVTNAVLGKLRASGGRIVLVSSLNGRISTPMTGAYNASKFALEAIADAWRLELRPWGVSVSLVEPAMTDTDMWRKAPEQQSSTEEAMAAHHRELYGKHLDALRRTIPRMQRMAKPAEGVAATIERALTASRPKARYVVGLNAKVQAAAMALLPQRMKDAALAIATGTPSKI
ncbi:MAG: SDR family NAD(P)-dependent oxidoreductase [Actinobacteria bacterium]|nr:MAG: SDR family NAD(P)-dependent oxidoreductase [Actinomycetota bacterium]